MSKQRGEPQIAQAINRPPRQPNRRHHTNHVGQLELELPTHEQPRSNLSFVLRPGPELPHKWLQVNGVDLNFLLNTGSTITTIDEATYQKWQYSLPQLERFTDQIQGYPQQPLAVVGQLTSTVAFGVSQTSEIIAVVAGKAVNLFSYRACVALDLVTINPQASQTCFSVKSLPEQYPSLIGYIGLYRSTDGHNYKPEYRHNRRASSPKTATHSIPPARKDRSQDRQVG